MWFALVAGIYLVMSSVTFVAFWLDKQAAARGSWRTPESTLDTLELLGGWPGALLAQNRFRHKSSKARYRSALQAIAAVHIVAWIVVGCLVITSAH